MLNTCLSGVSKNQQLQSSSPEKRGSTQSVLSTFAMYSTRRSVNTFCVVYFLAKTCLTPLGFEDSSHPTAQSTRPEPTATFLAAVHSAASARMLGGLVGRVLGWCGWVGVAVARHMGGRAAGCLGGCVRGCVLGVVACLGCSGWKSISNKL